MSAGDKMIVFKEQIVEKSTMCANCIHFDGDGTKTAEEWRPTKEALVAQSRRPSRRPASSSPAGTAPTSG